MAVAISSNKTTTLAAPTDSSHKRFLCSMLCCGIAFHPPRTSRNWSQSSQTLLLLHQLSLCDILNPVVVSTIFAAPAPGAQSVSRKPFFLLRKQLFLCYSFIMILQQSSPVPRLRFSFSFSSFPTSLQLSPPLKPLLKPHP